MPNYLLATTTVSLSVIGVSEIKFNSPLIFKVEFVLRKLKLKLKFMRPAYVPTYFRKCGLLLKKVVHLCHRNVL